ncbi:bifunctional phosphoribosylaminoimidazolecarboxamide formyltransferase/inosine monophosphate cyclohydrolase [Corynebacterium diphtheriae]|uniref:bifunctional phosphoribosylaminoimidazolecarboxamide formyltransferase/IMP cyclohydrolase n=1 Tax=Corynebacterium diphtheriae TaxID=1717 RepID=UPI000245BAD5|nr:bifunctional phosphoribosylaminoimidazolecarboxamide formyltransferase/IMP cyclohydrolase [Corynebacterium diphtheriae]AEX48321.1 bifunctionalphosphoribosylaminoimidazolecarboxam ide formyltransferase/IMP cyclohydrolase [Corynebacterium diphtheriae BH8]ERA53421.1 bifunctional phosphoribosylaminoimidazolecarboxamide formyltransferase/IMP cyclohydrolase [Corynebacterium diphtheriae str. Aberdeen]KLN42028.1 purine biosynthesis protein purH [Corynebacterium diphtheriae bv. gravis str. ISS 4746]K
MSDDRKQIKRALISVYDKTGLEDLARALNDAGVEIVSTGSTAAKIADLGVPVTPVEQLTGFPECLEGRVKTLHPMVHAGILADTRKEDHLKQLDELNVAPFQLVVVNLYPFTQTVASGADFDACVEQIDIGGPSMVRAAAKNHPSVAVVVSPARYSEIIEAVGNGGFTRAERTALAVDAFRHTASYDVAVATWMGEQIADADEPFAEWIGASYERANILRYGENPHQAAALYTDPAAPAGLAQATQLHGKEMSYNNYTDSDAAWRAAWDHERPCVAIIKHANPCGIAVSDVSIAEAHRTAHACDPVSAFGGVIASNREVSVDMAKQVSEIFTEVIIAPSYEDGAVDILSQKKNIRILVAPQPQRDELEQRQISGGVLVQRRDLVDAEGDNPANWTLAAGEAASEELLAELEFAWRAVRAVKSNAILLAQGGATVGVGMGQVNRVDAAKLAVERANSLAGDEQRAKGSVAASDAFFPFADGFEVLAQAGVRAVVQPGGSIRDAEVIEAANKAGVTMYLTGARHFAH